MIRLEARERTPFLCMALASASAASGALIARAAADTLFLSHHSPELLSVMYVGTGLSVGLLAYAFARRSRSVPLDRILIASCAILAIMGALLRLGLYSSWSGIYILTYLWSDLSVSGSMFLFWSFFGQVFDIRQARRLLGWVGAAGTLACIVAGFLIRPFTIWFETGDLLIVVVLLLLMFAASVSYAMRSLSGQLGGLRELSRSESSPPDLIDYLRLLTRPRVLSLASQAAIGTVVIVLVDYLFKLVAQSHYQGPKLASFFGNFYSVVNIFVLGIQLFAVQRLLQGKRLLASLCALPAGLSLGSGAVLLSASLWTVVGTKLIAQATHFTIDSSAYQVLYLGLKRQTRNQVRALVDGVCKPFAVGTTGATLVLASGTLDISILAMPALFLCLVWLFLARRNYALHVGGLVENLRTKALEVSGRARKKRDKSVEFYTRKALVDVPIEGLPSLIGAVQEMHHIDWSPQIRSLLRRPEPEIKLAALEYLSTTRNVEEMDLVVGHVSHPDPRVRRAAVRAAALAAEKNAELLRARLIDEDPRVRAEAACSLLSLGDLGSLLEGAAVIRAMLESPDTLHRAAVATQIGRIRLKSRNQVLLTLLSDPHPVVRAAALEASRSTLDSELVPAVLAQLWQTTTADEAAQALVKLGPLTVNYLSKSFQAAELTDLFSQSDRLAYVMARIDSPQALLILKAVLDTARGQPPTAALVAFCRILQRQRLFAPHKEFWDSLLHKYIAAARHRRRMMEATDALPKSQFLLRVLREDYQRQLHHIFLLLGVRATSAKMEGIRAQLDSGREEDRVHALEHLEHVVPANLAAEIMAVIGDKCSEASGSNDLPLLIQLLESETSEPIILGAIYATLETGARHAIPSVARYVSHPSGVVRETAQFIMECMDEAGNGRAQRKSSPPDIHVPEDSMQPANQFSKPVHLPGGDGKMILVEKMLFLGNVPLFLDVGTRELAHIASIAREMSYLAGQQIIRENEFGDHMFVIVDGEVRIHRGNTSLKMLGPQEFFGEMSMIDGEPRSASATAVSDCLLLRIDKGDFQELLTSNSAAALSVIRVLVKRVRELLPALERVERGL